jgi:WD40 repeat protein
VKKADPSESTWLDSGEGWSGPGEPAPGAWTSAPGASDPPPGPTYTAPITPPDDRYVRAGLLGKGGMGIVYLARDRRLERAVALKEAARGGETAVRLAREARVTAGLEHPGIVTVHDSGVTEDGRPFYTMRLLRGRALSALLSPSSPLAERLAFIRHYLDVCNAVGYAHSEGVIHRDIKPANIMIGGFGETQVVDWGLAARVGTNEETTPDSGLPDARDSATRTGAVFGTPAYMSPEQARGEPADPRSDVWSLGAVLFEILSGQPPRGSGTSDEVLARARAGGYAVSALVGPPELVAITTRAMAANPDQRYTNAGELAADVSAWLDGRPVGAYTYSARDIAVRFVLAWRAPLSVAGVALLVVAVLAAGAASRLSLARDRAVAAEGEVRTALETSDHNLLTALLSQARTAQASERVDRAEVLAAHALALGERSTHPDEVAELLAEARGIAAASRAAPRPRRIAAAAVPDCQATLALDVGDVVCADGVDVWRWAHGAEKWRVALPATWLKLDGDRVWAAHRESAVSLDLATGERGATAGAALFGGTWGVMVDNAPFGWQIALGRAVCGASSPTVVGTSRHIGFACVDGRVGDGPADGPYRKQTVDLSSLTGFTGLLSTVNHLLVYDARGQVAVADLATGALHVDTPGTANAVRTSASNADGSLVAVGRETGVIEVSTLPGLERVATLSVGRVLGLRFLDDGTLLVTEERRVSQWELPAAPHRVRLPSAEGIATVAVSPDGARIATGHSKGLVSLWDAASGALLHEARVTDETVKGVAFAQDGRLGVVTVGVVGLHRPLALDRDGAVTWSADEALRGAWIARVIAAQPGVVLPRPYGLTARRLVLLEGDLLIVAHYLKGLLATRLGTQDDVPLDCPAVVWTDLAASPDGATAVATTEAGGVYTVDAATLRCTPVPAPMNAGHVDVSSDGTVVMIGGDRSLSRSGPDGLRWTVPHPAPYPGDVTLSPNGRWVATAGPDRVARLLDAETGALVGIFPGHHERVSAVEFRPDSRGLVTGSWDGDVRLWDLDTLDVSPQELVHAAEETWGIDLDAALAE